MDDYRWFWRMMYLSAVLFWAGVVILAFWKD
jgi:hypothetical protein